MLADVDVPVSLARALLRVQHPDLADRPLVVVANGWDNVMMRLGDDLALRLPRREAAAQLVEHERTWLPRLAPALPVPVPVPVRAGRPDAALGYPYGWSVVPWFGGEPAARTTVARRTGWAGRLGDFLVALHVAAPAGAPENPFRGVPLARNAHAFEDRIDRAPLGTEVRLRRAWDLALAATPYDGPPVWLHGDLHPGNLVADVPSPSAGRATSRDTLAAVVDFGDVTSGDPASDLATAWLTFDAEGRDVFRRTVIAGSGWDDATWARARGWAAHLALVLLAHPDEHPLMAEIGRHAVEQIVEDAI
jgi:aminoglycoside phosphotransferase (APT) family kinase protein